MKINKNKILNSLNVSLTVCLIVTTIVIGLRNIQNYTVIVKSLEVIKRNDEIIKRNDEAIKNNQDLIKKTQKALDKNQEIIFNMEDN